MAVEHVGLFARIVLGGDAGAAAVRHVLGQERPERIAVPRQACMRGFCRAVELLRVPACHRPLQRAAHACPGPACVAEPPEAGVLGKRQRQDFLVLHSAYQRLGRPAEYADAGGSRHDELCVVAQVYPPLEDALPSVDLLDLVEHDVHPLGDAVERILDNLFDVPLKGVAYVLGTRRERRLVE